MQNVTSYRYYEDVDLTIGEHSGKISVVDWGKQVYGATNESTPLIEQAHQEIVEYLGGNRKTFDLPLELRGTPFENHVWKQLQCIPYGKTTTYKAIAIAVGDKEAVRAVGMACNHNPIAIIVPCHRVIGSDGTLVGYAGRIETKEHLLELEKKA